MKNYYDILGVRIDSSQDEIKKAYLKKIRKFHPDVFQGNKKIAEEQTSIITEAYSTLKDEDLKRKYDRKLNIDTNSLNKNNAANQKQKESETKKNNQATQNYQYTKKQKTNNADFEEWKDNVLKNKQKKSKINEKYAKNSQKNEKNNKNKNISGENNDNDSKEILQKKSKTKIPYSKEKFILDILILGFVFLLVVILILAF